jgi:hypothetical protein
VVGVPKEPSLKVLAPWASGSPKVLSSLEPHAGVSAVTEVTAARAPSTTSRFREEVESIEASQ